ncbi:MAG: hypothetical protein ABFR05_07695 [Bacteroidota bacterium]
MHFKTIPSILMLFYSYVLFSQNATEIYLFDLFESDSTIVIANPVNISQNKGYDNQPFFLEDGSAILFASMRDGQSDIARYEIEGNFRTWITDTKANEFSPSIYPRNKKFFTCVRMEDDGTQLLYKYAYKNKEPEVLIPDLKVGYYVWVDKNKVVSFVLGDEVTLQVSNFKHKIKYPIQQNIGRSLNKIPVKLSVGDKLISFISKSHEVSEIYAINPVTSESVYIVDAVEGSEDMVWTPQGSILMGKDDKIFKFRSNKDNEWTQILIDSDIVLKNITRMAVSPDGKKIAIVVEE